MNDGIVPHWYQDILTSYDTVAEEYAQHYFDELANKPFDYSLLTRFSHLVPEASRICDVGCGPGHVARLLSELGLEVVGVDVSEAMVQVARRLNPDLTFEQGDMLRLELPDATFGGIVAFYSLIHVDRPRILLALKELFRVLAPGGRLLAAFHAGEGEIHREEFLGRPVSFHATFFTSEEMRNNLAAAGFLVEEALEREPYDLEYPSQRAYILARKPGS